MNELELFKTELNLDEDVAWAEADDEGYIVRLNFYDSEYGELVFEGDLLQALGKFTRLRDLEVEVDGFTITDLSGLAAFPRLERLILTNCCRTADISVLSQLKYLQNLFIDGAGITSLEPLTELTNLTTLQLPCNRIDDINVLGGLVKLATLNLSDNRVTDVSVLAKCISLNSLYVSSNQISDLSFVAGLAQLEYLHFTKTLVCDITFISSLPLLKGLWFSGSPVTDISSLRGLNALIYLEMAGSPLTDLEPLRGKTTLVNLGASPVERFDGEIISGFSTLTGLRLEHCNISDLAFLRPLVKLQYLNLDNNKITELGPLFELPGPVNISLQNNGISNPHPKMLYKNLNSFNLTGNPFGNKLYERTGYPWNTFTELDADIGQYWFDHGDDDKAQAYYFFYGNTKVTLTIYYRKLLATDPADDYFRLYYVIRCEATLRNLKEDRDDEDVLQMRANIISIVRESDFFNKEELLICLEGNGVYNTRYFSYSEYTAYLNSGKKVKPHPEMLFELAKSTLGKRENLNQLLSIYQQLIRLESPLSFRVYRVVRHVLSNNFVGTPAYAYYIDLLENAQERDIPFFDTGAWFKEHYSHFIHDRPQQRQAERQPPAQFPPVVRTYADVSAWRIVSRLLLASLILLGLLKGCH